MSYYRWTYNHREGGADVTRFADTDNGPSVGGEWVAHVPNGLVAQAVCNWLTNEPDVALSLPLEMNPPRLYARP